MIKTSIRRFTLPADFHEKREILGTENCFRFTRVGLSLVYLHRKKVRDIFGCFSLSDHTPLVFSPFRFSSLALRARRKQKISYSTSYSLRTDVCIAVSIAVNAEIPTVSGPRLNKAPTETNVCGF